MPKERIHNLFGMTDNWWLLKYFENYSTLVRRKVSQIEPRLQYQKELGQQCVEKEKGYCSMDL